MVFLQIVLWTGWCGSEKIKSQEVLLPLHVLFQTRCLADTFVDPNRDSLRNKKIEKKKINPA